MVRMPDFAAEIEHDLGDLLHRHHQSQAPAAQPVTVEPATIQEGHMSLLDTIKNDVADVEKKLGSVDEEALGWVNAITANPEARAVMSDLAGLAGVVGLPAGAITGAATAIKTVLSLYPDQQQAAAPAAPAEPATAPAPAPAA